MPSRVLVSAPAVTRDHTLIFGVPGVQEMFFRLAKKIGREVEF